MNRLQNKVAIITGASAGIGRATALLFAAEGARLVVAARRQAELDSLVAEIEAAGGEAVALAGDVQHESFNKALVDLAISRYGRLDVAFNNAGTLGAMGPTDGIDADGWNQTLAVNLTSAFLGAKYQIPAIAAHGGGSVIFTSTFIGHTSAFAGMAAYAASKSGLIGLTQALATEYGPRAVRVNALLPGAVETEMYHTANDTPEARSFINNMHALKRAGQPGELARAALFLASDDSSFVTGTASLVDGGLSISRG